MNRAFWVSLQPNVDHNLPPLDQGRRAQFRTVLFWNRISTRYSGGGRTPAGTRRPKIRRGNFLRDRRLPSRQSIKSSIFHSAVIQCAVRWSRAKHKPPPSSAAAIFAGRPLASHLSGSAGSSQRRPILSKSALPVECKSADHAAGSAPHSCFRCRGCGCEPSLRND